MPISVKTTTNEAPDERARARTLLGAALGFRDCPPAVLDQLVAHGQLRRLRSGEFCVRRGDPVQHLWMVVSGLLEGSVFRSDGQRHLTGLIMPGSFHGLMSAVDGRVASHDMSARERSTVLAIPVELIRELRAREPSLVLAFERQIVFRARIVGERLMADAGMELLMRVASMLCNLAELYGESAGPAVKLAVKLSQSDLADWLGMSRQRVNFALKQLEADGLIVLHYSKLTITDLPRLKACASG